jgi:hypothetical protein
VGVSNLQWEWREHYRVALLETNPLKVLQLVAAAEEAIFLRTIEMSETPGGKPERQAIADAVSVLLILKRERQSPEGIKPERRPESGKNLASSA